MNRHAPEIAGLVRLVADAGWEVVAASGGDQMILTGDADHAADIVARSGGGTFYVAAPGGVRIGVAVDGPPLTVAGLIGHGAGPGSVDRLEAVVQEWARTGMDDDER